MAGGRITTVLLLVLGSSFAAAPAGGSPPMPDGETPSMAGPWAEEDGTLQVRVADEDTGQPLAGTTVRVRQVDRTTVTNQEGQAVFDDLPPRRYTVVVERLGYLPAEESIDLHEGEVATVEISLSPTPLDVAGIVVTGTGRERGAGEVYRPTTSLAGTELQRNLAGTVPATLRNVPGMAMQYNGPGASSPTIRGMSGDRVLMLEDGGRTGDLYQTASDHGVMVEPLTAQRMEVVRGAASLLYGSNALGGVVNVIREDVPRSRPSALQGQFASQAESVNEGLGGSVVVTGPAGPLALRGEISGREMGDTRTPAGTLERSDMSVYNGSFGATWFGERGSLGAAFRYYDNVYGVPGEFDGELIPGGHPGGVDIEATRTSGRVRGELKGPVLGFFDSVELRGNMTRYIHDEIEGLLAGDRVLGARFDQTTWDLDLTAHHDHAQHDHEPDALRLEGAFGFSLEARDLWAGGVSPGTRSGEEWTLSAFVFEELGREPFRIQAGLRYDHRQTTPASTDSLIVRTDDRRLSKPVEARSFGDFSGSIAGLWDFAPNWTVGASVARSVRKPAIEEMFSDGPHLADFSFDIGNPALDPEVGIGFDLFLRGTRRDLSLELATFFNRIDGFIHQMQTGETVRVVREGVPPRVTPVFEARSDDAVFAGAEGRVQWEFLPRLVFDATASYTRAWRQEDSDPLPDIPPLQGRAEVRYEGRTFSASFGMNGAARQDRVPAPIQVGEASVRPQEPTPGYGLVTAGAGWRHEGPTFTHSVTLQGENLLDRNARNHLSRIKDIAPQPGRNIQLTYRVHF